MNHLRAMRPHQWVKNVFVFAALVFSRNLTDGEASLRAFAAFVAFCLVASAIYLVNDIADIERDRVHPIKRKRPIANGDVAQSTAWLMAAFLAPMGFILAWYLNARTGATLTIYCVLNIAYSFGLKHVVLLDVFIIAAGFLLRVCAGAFAIEVGVSPWLVLCTFFVALFLAFCKRRHELVSLGDQAASHRGILSEYSIPFIDKMVSAVASMTVMSYALYTIDPKVVRRLGTDALVVTLPVVLFGIFRYLYLVHQKDQGGSPTQVILRDRGVQLICVLYLILVVGTIYYDVQLGLITGESP
jgi:4-hydroxybenzoate polyprenyltransferase